MSNKREEEEKFWMLILGLILGGALGIAIASKPKEKSETIPCPKCGNPVPIGAPLCPWCRVKLIWKA